MVYELPHELLNDLKLMILGNKEILGNLKFGWRHIIVPSMPSRNFGSSSQKTRKSRYQTFLVLSSFTGFLYFAPNILPRIVGSRLILPL